MVGYFEDKVGPRKSCLGWEVLVVRLQKLRLLTLLSRVYGFGNTG